MKKENVIQEKSFAFALRVLELYKQLTAEKEFIISKQLLRCGTSIGANVEEATAAISKKDFTAKMSIASKEARETRYWLQLLDKGDLVEVEVASYLDDIEQIINILTAIVKTSQGK